MLHIFFDQRFKLVGITQIHPVADVSDRRSFIAVHLLSQYSRALKRDHPTRGKRHRFSRLWVSPSSSALFRHREFSEPAVQNIPAFFQRLLHQFKESLDDAAGFALGENIPGEEILNNLSLVQCRHGIPASLSLLSGLR